MLETPHSSHDGTESIDWRPRIARGWVAHRRAISIGVLALALVLMLANVPLYALRALLNGLLAQRALATGLLLFALIALSLLWSAGQTVDAWVFLRINVYGPHPPVADRLMGIATQLGNVGTAATLAALALATGRWRLAIEIALGVISLWLLVELIKALASRTRPYRLFEQARIVGWRAAGPSFPSGHTSQAFFLASLLAHHFQLYPWLTVLLYVLAALVGFTRMYVGAHYPRDVLAGLIAGWAWGLITGLVDQGWAAR
jgi:membrane-associated phospholipid phosphatase